jgi:uncharacterized repeat protein (TIGR03809 family)
VPLRPESVFLVTGRFMTHRLDVARGRDIVARWCALAEQRLEYLTELFETGRWRRYHSELAFLENIQEAKSAVETWRDLSTREAAFDNSAIDFSWLGQKSPLASRGDRLRAQPRNVQPLIQIRAEPPQQPPIAAEAAPAPSDEALSAPVQLEFDDGMELTLDLDLIETRYPVLRNRL